MVVVIVVMWLVMRKVYVWLGVDVVHLALLLA